MPEHTQRHVPVTTLANGHQVTIPVHTITGSDGPRLGLVSGVHGDEPLAVETVRRVLLELADADLRGTVTAVTVANPYAHMALTRNTPLDGANLNRIFPGNAGGTVTEQVAAALVDLLVGSVDYLIDFHSGGIQACVDYAYIHEDGAELSKAYGADVLYRGPGYAGSFTSITREAGIPSVVSEYGGASARIDHYLAKGVAGTSNVMRHLGMLPGDVSTTPGQRIVETLVNLPPRNGGILLSELTPDDLGTEFPRGTVLGRVISPYTLEELETIEAPFERNILILTRPSYTNVAPGDYGYMVADATTATDA
ncbi:MAG TPA: succinylglutamate desuccinylase/aspartoacylase family protein [Nakamurella sp.]|jgi:predicted deacylase|nr:succinylglutamate desuccinylase/aspartoacylase family protein [Nakamurella sp.]